MRDTEESRIHVKPARTVVQSGKRRGPIKWLTAIEWRTTPGIKVSRRRDALVMIRTAVTKSGSSSHMQYGVQCVLFSLVRVRGPETLQDPPIHDGWVTLWGRRFCGSGASSAFPFSHSRRQTRSCPCTRARTTLPLPSTEHSHSRLDSP